MQEKESKFNKRMSLDEKDLIVKLKTIGKNNIEISRQLGYSSTAIRLFLKTLNIDTSLKVDRSRPCKVCGVVFTPKHYDGIKKNKYTNCSPECGKKALINSKIRYTKEEIERVIELKKIKITNSEIAEITKVDINKIKEIIKDNDLFLTSQEAQANAYKKKIEKNPSAMTDMRETRMNMPHNQYLTLVKEIYNLVKNGDKTVDYWCNQHGLNANSVRGTFHKNGWGGVLFQSVSLQELEVFDFTQKHLPKEIVEQSNRSILKGKEIDIYIPSLSLGIEYCGLYWHTEAQGKHEKYHYEKMKQANEQGIRLITIFEDEWVNRQAQVKNFLKSVFGAMESKVFARKCSIKEVDKEIAKKFLDDNHIQGSTVFKVAFGLFHNESLVGLVTGNKHHRQGFDNIFVLNRLVFKDGVQVVDGADKLLKHLCVWSKENGFLELISWSDNRYSEGDVYEATGFALMEELGPDYSYVTPEGTRQSKQSNQKKHVLKKGDFGKAELEMTLSIGYSRIWDCGKKRWSIIL